MSRRPPGCTGSCCRSSPGSSRPRAASWSRPGSPCRAGPWAAYGRPWSWPPRPRSRRLGPLWPPPDSGDRSGRPDETTEWRAWGESWLAALIPGVAAVSGLVLLLPGRDLLGRLVPVRLVLGSSASPWCWPVPCCFSSWSGPGPDWSRRGSRSGRSGQRCCPGTEIASVQLDPNRADRTITVSLHDGRARTLPTPYPGRNARRPIPRCPTPWRPCGAGSTVDPLSLSGEKPRNTGLTWGVGPGMRRREGVHSQLPAFVQRFARISSENGAYAAGLLDWCHRGTQAVSDRLVRRPHRPVADPRPGPAWSPPLLSSGRRRAGKQIVRDHSARVFRLAYRLTGNSPRRRGPHPGRVRPGVPLAAHLPARHVRGLAAPHHHQPVPGRRPTQAEDPLRRSGRRLGGAPAEPLADPLGGARRRRSRPRRRRRPGRPAARLPSRCRALRHRRSHVRGDRRGPRHQDRHRPQSDPPRSRAAARRARPSPADRSTGPLPGVEVEQGATPRAAGRSPSSGSAGRQ